LEDGEGKRRRASKLTPTEIENLLIKTAEIDLQAATLETWMKALDDMYTRALTKP
jgi:hypothetical protein